MITSAVLRDPSIVLSSASWCLSVVCPWVFETPVGLVSWEDDEGAISKFIHEMEGVLLVRAEIPESMYDPVFIFSNFAVVRVKADTSLDPWILSIDGLDSALVGIGPQEARDIAAEMPEKVENSSFRLG